MKDPDLERTEDIERNAPQPITLAAKPIPNNPPWNSLVAFGVWAVSVLLIVILPSLFLLPYIASRPVKPLDNAQLLEFIRSDPMAILIQVVAVLPAHLLTFLLAWLIVTRLRRYPFRETVGWTSGGMKWWHYIAILVSFLAVAGVVGNYFPEQDNDLLRILRSSRSAVFLIAFFATFTAPLVEEVVYRGILYSAFQRTFGVIPAVIFVTLLFTAVHVPQYLGSTSTIAMLALLSLILTLVRVYTNNLLPCIILHTAFNGLQSAFLLLEPVLKEAAEQSSRAFFVY